MGYFVESSNDAIAVKKENVIITFWFSSILGDPGSVSGGGEKSKTGEKKFRVKKSQEREEEPLGTRF